MLKRIFRGTLKVARKVLRAVKRTVRNVYYMSEMKSIELAIVRSDPPSTFLQSIDDSFWLWMQTEGYRRSPVLREILPAMPNEDLQRNITGSAGDSTLREAFRFYTLVKQLFRVNVGPWSKHRTLLDFGCGWGRTIRFFLKDLEPSNLWGVDAGRDLIEVCRQTNKWCNFESIDALPPTAFADGKFDLVYAYSVFSHLPEVYWVHWLAEFNRILKPNGLLIATTRDREFIIHCAKLRKDPKLASYPLWLRISAVAFPDTAKSLSDYDLGLYCYTSLGIEGEYSFFGEAAIPKGYVMSHLTRDLTFIEFIEDRRLCPQNVIVIKKT